MTAAANPSVAGTSTGRGLQAGAIVLATVLVLALAAIGWGQWWLHAQHRTDDRAATARRAADAAVTAVLSYDYRRLQADIDATSRLVTGDAKTQYAELSGPLLTTAPPIHAIMQAEVRHSAVLRSTGSSEDLLLFVDMTESSTKLAQPRIDQTRILASVTLRDGRWLLSAIRAV